MHRLHQIGTDDSQNDSDDNTPIECNPGTPTEAPEPIVPIHSKKKHL